MDAFDIRTNAERERDELISLLRAVVGDSCPTHVGPVHGCPICESAVLLDKYKKGGNEYA